MRDPVSGQNVYHKIIFIKQNTTQSISKDFLEGFKNVQMFFLVYEYCILVV